MHNVGGVRVAELRHAQARAAVSRLAGDGTDKGRTASRRREASTVTELNLYKLFALSVVCENDALWNSV